MITARCNKCKRVSVEISREEAEKGGYLKNIIECDCGNSYKNFSENTKILPVGVTLSSILRRENSCKIIIGDNND